MTEASIMQKDIFEAIQIVLSFVLTKSSNAARMRLNLDFD